MVERLGAVEGVVNPAPGPRYEPSRVPGVGVLVAPWHEDRRGSFTKPFSPSLLAAGALSFAVTEVYWSRSVAGTIRGLHLQLPPTAVAKVVFVLEGRVTDVVLDVRAGSPTYGQHVSFDLTPDSGAIHVPIGCAHGFEVTEGDAIMCYLQDGEFDPATDAGIRWDSAGIPWQGHDPTISDRDRRLPLLRDFASPFTWDRP